MSSPDASEYQQQFGMVFNNVLLIFFVSILHSGTCVSWSLLQLKFLTAFLYCPISMRCFLGKLTIKSYKYYNANNNNNNKGNQIKHSIKPIKISQHQKQKMGGRTQVGSHSWGNGQKCFIKGHWVQHPLKGWGGGARCSSTRRPLHRAGATQPRSLIFGGRL